MSPPTSDADYPKCKEQLLGLRAALVYWGKIIQRQDMLKLIRESPNLMANEEHKARYDSEIAFLKQEKEKFVDEEAAKKTDINYDMLKIAQGIAKEAAESAKKLKPVGIWDEVDSDAEDEDIGQQDTPSVKTKAKK